jgi:hypothetical protein
MRVLEPVSTAAGALPPEPAVRAVHTEYTAHVGRNVPLGEIFLRLFFPAGSGRQGIAGSSLIAVPGKKKLN